MTSAASVTGEARPAKSLNAPGLLLGIGLGGFVDGIVLHQILQWHHMLTGEDSYPATTVAGLEVNTLWDGLFHASTYVFTAIGLLLLALAVTRGVQWSGRQLLGLLLAGWGTFNLVEGVVDHHILGIHHVRRACRSSISPSWPSAPCCSWADWRSPAGASERPRRG